MLEWDDIKRKAVDELKARGLDDPGNGYAKRLALEIKEVEKQGANAYWIEKVNDGYKYSTNKNGLVLPWLFGMTNVDPIGNNIELKVGSDDGIEEDAIVLILANGCEVVVSPHTMVLTERGYIIAHDLRYDDTLI